MQSGARDGSRWGPARATVWLTAPLLAVALLAAPATTPSAAGSMTLLASFDGSGIAPPPAHPFQPTRIAVDEQTHDVYVIDEANAAVDRFDADGRFLSQLDASSSPSGTFRFQAGDDSDIAVDDAGDGHAGTVYVADESGRSAFAFDPSGQFLWEKRTSDPPPFDAWDPCGVSVDPGGVAYVSDYATASLIPLAASGASAGSPLFVSPSDPACHTTWGADGTVYWARWSQGIGSFGGGTASPLFVLPAPPALKRAYALATSADMLLADMGSALFAFGAHDTQVPGQVLLENQISDSRGIAVDHALGRIYVSDRADGSLRVYRMIQPPTIRYDGVAMPQLVVPGQQTVGAAVNPNGDQVTSCHVEWTGPGLPAGMTTTCQPMPGAGAEFVPVSSTLSGVPGGTYEYRFVATNGGGTSAGALRTVDIYPPPPPPAPPSPPAVTTGAAGEVTSESVAFVGTVDPHSQPIADCHFDYGPTAAYGQAATCAPQPGAADRPVTVGATVAVDAGATLHYRLSATSSAGTTAGADATVDALAVPPPLLAPAIAAAGGVPPAAVATATTGRSGTVAISAARLHGVHATVVLACRGAPPATCTGTLTLETTLRLQRKRRVVALARAPFRVVAPGAAIRLRLPPRARRLLSHRPGLAVTAIASGASRSVAHG